MSIRIKESNREAALAAIPGSRIVKPDRSFAGGCGDPDCCYQHPLVIDGEPALGLELPEGWSGTRAHKALVAAGITKRRL